MFSVTFSVIGLKIIFGVLDQDADFKDTVQATMELLITLCSPPVDAHRVAATNTTDSLLPKTLRLQLPFLARTNFRKRSSTVELLTTMKATLRFTLQASFIKASQGAVHTFDAFDDTQKLSRSNVVTLLAPLARKTCNYVLNIEEANLKAQMENLTADLDVDTKKNLDARKFGGGTRREYVLDHDERRPWAT